MKEDNKYDKWCIEDAARSLERAEEIKQDPKMMKLVAKELKKKLKATKKSIASIQDLKDASAEMDKEDYEG